MSDTEPNGLRRTYSLRLQMPVDDDKLTAFLEAQGPRSQANGVLALIHMFVNEFGAVNVTELIMGRIGLSNLREGEDLPLLGSVVAPAAEAVDISEPTESTPAVAPAVEIQPAAEPAASPAASTQPSTVDDIFRK